MAGKAFCKTWAAVWNDGVKSIWTDGQFGQSDAMLPIQPTPVFEEYIEQIKADSINKNAKPISTDLMKMLQKAGYLE